MKTKRNDDWMEQAEKLGQQLADGLERFGDRVAKAIEGIEQQVTPHVERATRKMNVDDQRPPRGPSVQVEDVRQGDVFELKGQLYMRLGLIPEARRGEEIDAVHLETGDVRLFERGQTVVPVEATLVVKNT